MIVKNCDQCKKPMTAGKKPMTAGAGFDVRNHQRLSAAGISPVGEPNTLDLCSWRCMEEYARDRAA